MKGNNLLLLALLGFVISLGFFITIYLTKGNNFAESSENDLYSNISYKILSLSSESVDNYES